MTKRSVLFKGLFCLLAVFAVFAVFSVTSCGYGAYQLFHHGEFVDERADELMELSAGKVGGQFSSISGTYTFVLFSDPHYGSKRSKDIDEDAFLAWLDGLDSAKKPKFCICLGDIAEHGVRSEFVEFQSFADKIESRGVPVMSIVGNHDLFNSGWSDFTDICFPYTSFYHFKTAGFSYYALDTGSGSLGPKQMKILKKAMERDRLPKIVFMHYPLYGSSTYNLSYYSLQNEEESTRLITLFEKEDVTDVYAGHVHHHQKKNIGSYTEVDLDTLYNNEWLFVTVNEAKGTTKTETIRN
ncbi:MAG: metallophosphoesterase [Treponema sp.]|nr:metallophosphoesterase [Treponema sp.]